LTWARSSGDGSETIAAKKPRQGEGGSIDFNHAMVYVQDVPRSLAFYRDGLGLELIEELEGYARLRSPNGSGTLGLHILSEEKTMMNPTTEGIRLYFEAEDVDAVCARLANKGYAIDQPPKDMPWGWRHAYLKDPDGHEVSVYHAGEARFRASPPM